MDGKLVLSTTIMNMMEKKLCVTKRRQNDWTADWIITATTATRKKLESKISITEREQL